MHGIWHVSVCVNIVYISMVAVSQPNSNIYIAATFVKAFLEKWHFDIAYWALQYHIH